MSKKDEDSLQELLAEAIYASGTPLCITENPYWLKFFNALRPSFNLPSRNQISNNLLDSVFVRTQNMVNEKIESATTVGVQCDAWSNIRKEGIINFIVTTPAPVFFKTFPTGTESQTALYISEKIGKITYIARNLKLLNPSPKNTEEECEEDEESNKGEDEISEICAEHEEVEFLEEEFTQD
ncbi:uncharacterized protein [Chelonus insularis]|uniref:uncharacterized protein n=1 Tax=Chelonus insularis TaxID=460826 RepID=UPI00158C04E5|nr:uncharacterized protein LOC118070095 [Chelonus insularis]